VISVGILLVALVLSWFLLAGRAAGPLTPLERVYLLVSPLPVLLMFGIPLTLELLRVSAADARAWNGRLDPVATGLSTALILAGVALTWRRFSRGEDRKSRLTAAIFLSGIPAFLTLLVGLFYGLRRVR
jgi:hypothetical protein